MKTLARKQSSRDVHEQVVRKAAERLNQDRFDVHLNPGWEENLAVDGFYPGVVVTRRGSDRLVAIMEVETEESLARPGTTDLWNRYCRMGVPFYLLVPSDRREEVRNGILTWKPTPLLGTYAVADGGRVDLEFMA